MDKPEEYNDWTVLRKVSTRHWECHCKCGRTCLVSKYSLLDGSSSRCKSCRSRENGLGNKRNFYPEGVTGRVIQEATSAIARCTNEQHPRWNDWGGRGVKVCSEWIEDKVAFVAYLMSLTGWNDEMLVLDREDNEGNYEPGNLRYVSHAESLKNRRKYKKRQ